MKNTFLKGQVLQKDYANEQFQGFIADAQVLLESFTHQTTFDMEAEDEEDQG